MAFQSMNNPELVDFSPPKWSGSTASHVQLSPLVVYPPIIGNFPSCVAPLFSCSGILKRPFDYPTVVWLWRLRPDLPLGHPTRRPSEALLMKSACLGIT